MNINTNIPDCSDNEYVVIGFSAAIKNETNSSFLYRNWLVGNQNRILLN